MSGTKYLITGCSGFVGYYFIKMLVEKRVECNVLGLDMAEPVFDFDLKGVSFEYSDSKITDIDNMVNCIRTFQPDYIVHLASYSSVGLSWQHSYECFYNNTNIILCVFEAVKKSGVKCRILSIGSSEEYGNVSIEDVPLVETKTLNPISPYGIARVSQEMLSKLYAESYGLDIVLTRSFNHIGPRQRVDFVIPSFANQMSRAKVSGEDKVVLSTGDVSIIRDFLDVRDVVKAYDLILEKGETGEIYNICGGRGISLKEMIELMSDIIGIEVRIEIDSARIRPNDNKVIIGSYSKINKELGWAPEIGIRQSLKDVLDYEIANIK